MTDAFSYYGEPEPFELLAATSKFFQVAVKADERFGALPAYDRAIQLIPLEAGGKRPASGFLPSKHKVPKTHEALALLAAAYPDANALQSRTSQGADADAARVRALAAYKRFLTLWKDANPDIPILKEAKAEFAKLQ
jgi:hypothetical protein